MKLQAGYSEMDANPNPPEVAVFKASRKLGGPIWVNTFLMVPLILFMIVGAITAPDKPDLWIGVVGISAVYLVLTGPLFFFRLEVSNQKLRQRVLFEGLAKQMRWEDIDEVKKVHTGVGKFVLRPDGLELISINPKAKPRKVSVPTNLLSKEDQATLDRLLREYAPHLRRTR